MAGVREDPLGLPAGEREFWIEWTTYGNGTASIDLEAWDTTTNTLFRTETITYRPFNSTTAVFVGENQTPGDADYSPQPNGWAIQELLNGYDVHVWDDGHDWFNWGDDADPDGSGPAHDEIVNAVNNRGVTEVALHGYSHGGGTVYNVAWRLDNNYAASDGSTINDPASYDLVFTSYIDGIRNGNPGLALPERRRPLESDYHLNQYQRNTVYLRGHSILDAQAGDDDLNRTDLPTWHNTKGDKIGINDHEEVIEKVTEEFEERVNR